MLYESLVGQSEYTAQPKGFFWCHVIDKGVVRVNGKGVVRVKGHVKGVVLLIDIHKSFLLVLYLSFSFRYLAEVKKMPLNLKNQAASNHFHNILRLFDVLPNVLFTKSETKRHY